jgi:hypothetical protein
MGHCRAVRSLLEYGCPTIPARVPLPVDPEGALALVAAIRILVIALALAYCVALRPAHATAGAAQRQLWIPPLRLHWIREHRANHAVARHAAARHPLGLRAVTFARRLVGTPYSWGGDSPRTGFDCSGFVRFVYGHFGLALPHSSYADFDLGVRVPRGALRPGDLVFFDGVGHVGLYVGRGRFIHAPHSGTSVQITSLSDPWYRASYDGARRLVSKPVAHAHRLHGQLGARHPGARRFLAALQSKTF